MCCFSAAVSRIRRDVTNSSTNSTRNGKQFYIFNTRQVTYFATPTLDLSIVTKFILTVGQM